MNKQPYSSGKTSPVTGPYCLTESLQDLNSSCLLVGHDTLGSLTIYLTPAVRQIRASSWGLLWETRPP